MTTMSTTPEGTLGSTPAPRTRSRAQLVTAIVGIALFAAFAAIVAQNPAHPFTQAMDDAWRRLVGSGHGPETAPFPMFFQYLGELPGTIVLGLLIPILLLCVRRWRSALFFFTAMIATTFAAQLVKNLVNRPRPADDQEAGLYGPLFQVDHGSLPSGHAVTAGFAVVAIAALVPAGRRWIWWIIGTLVAIGMVWQRTFINAHWLSDCIIGLVAGASVATLIRWAFAPLLAKDAGKPARRPRPSIEGAA